MAQGADDNPDRRRWETHLSEWDRTGLVGPEGVALTAVLRLAEVHRADRATGETVAAGSIRRTECHQPWVP